MQTIYFKKHLSQITFVLFPNLNDTLCKANCKIEILFTETTKVHPTTDWHRRIGTLIRNMLLLENPQFLFNNYETL